MLILGLILEAVKEMDENVVFKEETLRQEAAGLMGNDVLRH